MAQEGLFRAPSAYSKGAAVRYYCRECGSFLWSEYEQKVGYCLKCMSRLIAEAERADEG